MDNLFWITAIAMGINLFLSILGKNVSAALGWACSILYLFAYVYK